MKIVSDPGNMRRANHGPACLPVRENQDVRIDHQIRQVERREARKAAAAAERQEASLAAAKSAKLLLPVSPAAHIETLLDHVVHEVLGQDRALAELKKRSSRR